MRFFQFWIPLMLACWLLSSVAIGTGIPQRSLDGPWHAAIQAACASHRAQCLSVTIEDQVIGHWDGKRIVVKAVRSQEAAAVALLRAQLSPQQQQFVQVVAETTHPKATR